MIIEEKNVVLYNKITIRLFVLPDPTTNNPAAATTTIATVATATAATVAATAGLTAGIAAAATASYTTAYQESSRSAGVGKYIGPLTSMH